MAETANVNMYKDMDRLVEMRNKGQILNELDEQRLRNYQLRRLRRLYLKDQILSPREPLHPPKHLNFYQRLKVKEAAFWDRNLKFQQFSDHFHKGYYSRAPLLVFYKFQRFVRRFYGLAVLPSIPIVYLCTYGNFDVPNMMHMTYPKVFPGDKTFTTKAKDLEFDYMKYTYVNPENKKQ